MAFLQRDGANIYYDVVGADENTITLINGHSRSSRDFRGFAKFLSEHDWRVVLVDNRGVGKTEATPPFTVNDIVQDILAIWDELGISGSAVLGVSLGGVIAMKLALEAARRTHALILISTSARIGRDRRKDTPNPADSEKAAEAWTKFYVSPHYAEQNALFMRSLAKELARQFRDPTAIAGLRAQRDMVASVDLADSLPALQTPTLIIHGTDDAIIPCSAAEELHDRIRQSQFERWEGMGHLLLVEAPQRLYRAVLDFLESHRST